MINKVIFKKIKFHNIHTKNFDKYILRKGLFVFPAAPGLASLSQSKKYHESLRKADLVFFDTSQTTSHDKIELINSSSPNYSTNSIDNIMTKKGPEKLKMNAGPLK